MICSSIDRALLILRYYTVNLYTRYTGLITLCSTFQYSAKCLNQVIRTAWHTVVEFNSYILPYTNIHALYSWSPALLAVYYDCIASGKLMLDTNHKSLQISLTKLGRLGKPWLQRFLGAVSRFPTFIPVANSVQRAEAMAAATYIWISEITRNRNR